MYRKKLFLCLIGAQLSAALPVWAAGEGTVLEEIIVTATKRSQSLQDVAMAVTAISADDMNAKGISDLQGIVQLVPSLNWGEHFGTTMVSIRGVGSIVDSGITEPTVALYVDGVFLPRSTMATLRAVDLERVEVLRGPQGTLYGRNATGGAVNFVSNAPSDQFAAGVNLGSGSRDAYDISGFVTGPLAEGISGRLSAGREKQDGYVKVNGKELLGGVDVEYVRGALAFQLSDDLSLGLSARHEKNSAANAFQQFFTDSVIAPPGLYTTEPNKIIADKPFSQQSKTTVLAANIDWVLSDNLTLRSITSYVDHKSNAQVDSDGSAIDFNYVPGIDGGFERISESYGQEFNLVGETDSVDWLVGAFLYHEDSLNSLPVTLGEIGGPANGLPPGITIIQPVEGETDSWALYGDMTWSMTERLRLNLGLRYNHEKQDFLQTWGLVLPTPGGLIDVAGPVAVALNDESDKVLPKVGLQYDLSEEANIYVQWSMGYKSGGANLPGGGAENLGQLYKPEEIDAFEVGLKTQWLDGAVTWNTAAFYYDYMDMQVTRNAPPAVTVVDNSDAEVYGIETELWWNVSHNFRINGGVTLLHSRFKDYIGYDSVLGVFEDLDGATVPQSPDYVIAVGGDYTVQLGGELFNTLTFSGNIKHTDDVVLRQFSGPENIQDGYSLVNVSATLADKAELTRLTLFVNNVGDEEYKQHTLNYGIGYMGSYGPPRTWGLRLSRDF